MTSRFVQFVVSVWMAFVALLIPFAVYAQAVAPTVDTQMWWQNLLVLIITSVVTIATPIISVLIMVLVKKWNLKIEQEKVDWIVTKAVGYGEQYAKNKLKDGKLVEGPEIAKVALEYGTKLGAMYAPKLGSYLAELIEAKLGEAVVAAGGATATVNLAKPPVAVSPVVSTNG